jgi:hypothetical protein
MEGPPSRAALRFTGLVIAGPPRSGVIRQSILRRMMDRRVKPGDDASWDI